MLLPETSARPVIKGRQSFSVAAPGGLAKKEEVGSTMAVRPVHWHEGMFLRPHHFQAAQRYIQYLTHQGEKWDHHYNWGLRSAEIDVDALANNRLVVRSLKARLRDGSLVSIPEDGTLPTVDLKTALEGNTHATVFLAVPLANLGKANVSTNGTANGTRFRLDVQESEDENTGVNPQPIQVRLLNLKLLLDTEDHAGYEMLPICRVQKSAKAEGTPELDVTYIPPLLACEAWPPLLAGILQQIYDRIGQRIQLLAELVVSRGITFDSQAQGDPQLFAQLRALNEAYALMGVLFFAQGVHPFPAYLELCRLVGQLSIFGPARRPPDVPRYDHDDLGGCFYRLKHYIDALFEDAPKPDYKERPFVGAALRMQVSLEPSWLESIYQLFVGVKSTLAAEECINLLTKSGLDMKFGSSDRVDDIFKRGSAGLRFAHSPRPPRALPSLPGLIYFQVNRESQLEEWQNVQKSLTLAIRLNENRIAGNIQRQRVLTIKTSNNQTTTLQFTLYVVPQEHKPGGKN
jgi:type VI secretion system protein ImpJ